MGTPVSLLTTRIKQSAIYITQDPSHAEHRAVFGEATSCSLARFGRGLFMLYRAFNRMLIPHRAPEASARMGILEQSSERVMGDFQDKRVRYMA